MLYKDIIKEKVTGPNIMKQLDLVAPDLFKGIFVAFKMVEKPKERQHQHYPRVVDLEPKVIITNYKKISPGVVMTLGEVLVLVKEGCSVIVSPRYFRTTGSTPSKEVLEKKAYDRLVVAALSKGLLAQIYSNCSFATNVGMSQIAKGIGQLCVHYVFLPDSG